MFFFSLTPSYSSAAAKIKVSREHAKGERAEAEGHMKPVATSSSSVAAAVVVPATAVRIVTGVHVEVDVGKSPAAEKVFESVSAGVGRGFGPLALRARRNFVSGIFLVVGTATVKRHQFIAGNGGFAYGASLAVRASLQPLVDAGPAVKMPVGKGKE